MWPETSNLSFLQYQALQEILQALHHTPKALLLPDERVKEFAYLDLTPDKSKKWTSPDHLRHGPQINFYPTFGN